MVRQTILDVQSTSWHDEYLKFRTGTKELEVMVQNVINGIFATVTTIQEGVEILEVFSDMGSREVRPPSLSPSLPHSFPSSLTPSLPHITTPFLHIPLTTPHSFKITALPLSSSFLSSFTPSILLFPILPPPLLSSLPPSYTHIHTYIHVHHTDNQASH